ncbi:MAG: hypothetical protein JNL69_03045, partial [Bacteroidia bacterium]|nr:hypothetical protein [Bacteroidia bacterium]
FPVKEFIKHLRHPGNNRILFSGKFGIGKSYFLDHFFKEKTQISNMSDVLYEAFHIYPVNYSIASNEDIFRYIKYDVITTLLLKGIKLEDTDLTYLDTLPDYLKGNLLKVLATLIYMIPKVGKDVYESYEKLEELKKSFEKHHTAIKKQDGDKLIEFLEQIEGKEGSIFENDVITKLIHNILSRIKKQNSKENVLIIDDLDRIDPEHVFRLLNVFAAHLENPKGLPNKLGFDKIIIVCDINNLRNIFSAKYGAETDFNGYIDKFYSVDVYHFDNRQILKEISYEVFKNVDFVGIKTQEIGTYNTYFFRSHNVAYDLCSMLITNGMLSLRTLVNKHENRSEIDLSIPLQFSDMSLVSYRTAPILLHFRILKKFVGSYDILKTYLNRIPLRAYVIDNMNYYANMLLLFVHYEKTLRTQGDIPISFNNKVFYIALKGRLEDSLNTTIVYEGRLGTSDNPIQYNYTTREFNTLLNEFLDLLNRVEN